MHTPIPILVDPANIVMESLLVVEVVHLCLPGNPLLIIEFQSKYKYSYETFSLSPISLDPFKLEFYVA